MSIEDIDLLEAINKGSFWLKLKKLRALGFIRWARFPHIEITADGKEEIERIRERKSVNPNE